jgi:hypothetical protein
LTLEKFVVLWLSGKELSRRPRTVFQYRQIANTHILPFMGSMKIKDIVPGYIKQLYAIKREEGIGANSANPSCCFALRFEAGCSRRAIGSEPCGCNRTAMT